jgi:general secretion pathway protein G
MYCAHCGSQVQTLAANCPRCGQPASGATIKPGGSAASSAAIIGIVIGGLLLFVFIVGIVAAIAIPNLLSAINRGRQKRTIVDIRTVATAVEAYATDHGFYPDADSAEQLATLLEPSYISVMPRTDGWRTPLGYTCWSSSPSTDDCDSYVIASAARNLLFEYDLSEYGSETVYTNDFDEDIVYCNGEFIQLPEGIGY